MPIYQAWNGRTKRWVKYHWTKQGAKIVGVKQREPTVPFEGVPIKGNKR